MPAQSSREVVVAEAADRLDRIEVVSERTPTCGSYLKLRHLTLRNRYADGSASAEYPCDIMERPGTDAVGVVAWYRGEEGIRVLVREGIRPPAYFRRARELPLPDPTPYLLVAETVAGGLEPGDRGVDGIQRRAAAELLEEAGFEVEPERVMMLGGGYFPSPGTYTEKVYLAAIEVDPAARKTPTTNDPMEAGARLLFYDLREALRRCQGGSIPDPKAEMGFRRLADQLGYLPELGCFVEELPQAVQDRYRRIGERE